MHPRPRQAIVREALEAGLDVFVPKPPGPSLEATHDSVPTMRLCQAVYDAVREGWDGVIPL